ncbi:MULTISPECIES: SPOR domain-containing protein [unclassified Sphingomonas]|jgi:rare lipoprotein A|uniref:SPOR domain-containing protein n=1 Tax=unclassified Sphingomonas TaxID=196159 RepID=UPI0008320014|nr:MULTISPECIES: SPOR domain-containing protein [unclassified Sphingomonas]
MKSRVDLTLAALLSLGAATAAAQDTPATLYPADAADKPRGSSGEGAAARHDEVGPVGVQSDLAGMRVVHPALAAGDVVEVTALGNGHNVLAIVQAGAADRGRIASISPALADALGIAAGDAVRLRKVVASAADRAALRAGGKAAARLDSPPALLAGLRATLAARAQPAASAPTPSVTAPTRRRATPPVRSVAKPTRVAVPAGTGYFVRVAVLSIRERADSVARELDGEVVAAGKLHLVRIGPLPDRAAAAKARERAVARGFKDALIVAAP